MAENITGFYQNFILELNIILIFNKLHAMCLIVLHTRDH